MKPALTQALKPLAVALLLALPLLAAPAHAAPAVAHWTVTDFGPLPNGFDLSLAFGINDAGQVVGYSAASTGPRAFLWQNGAMTDLGDLPGGSDTSFANGINAAGQVVGYSSASAGDRAFLWQNGTMTDLGDLPGGGDSSRAYGINAAGQVVGYSGASAGTRAFLWQSGAMTDLGDLPGGSDFSVANGINDAGQVVGSSSTGSGTRAFLWEKVNGLGSMTDLGDLPGGSDYSEARGINAAGQVVGYSYASTGYRAFLWQNGAMTDLGDLPGGGDSSRAYGINAAGQVVGYSDASTENRAFLWQQVNGVGVMTDLNSLNGAAGSGFTMYEAYAINDLGQIAGLGRNGAMRGFVLTLDTTVWGGAPNSSWEEAANWSYGLAPNKNTHAYIEPVGSRTILGPTGAVEVKQLTIGGNPLDSGAIATLKLNGGQITMLPDDYVGLEVTANGVLTGQGTIRSGNGNGWAFNNYGRIVADDVTLQGIYVYNQGIIEGDGRLAVAGINNYGGSIRVAHAGDRLRLDAPVGNYSGTIDVIRGEVEISGFLSNDSQINLRDGVLRTTYLYNGANSRLDISSGASDVFGTVINWGLGRIVVSGQGQATFWNQVENYGELRVSSGSVATFFGDFYARTGGTLSGTGSKYYESGYFIGNSPGVATDSGNVAFGSDAFVEVEIGGLDAGNGDGFHDQLIVLGELSLDGTLKLVSWKGFTGEAGDSFDLFDWGTLTGTFDAIDSTGFLLADGTTLDYSHLYEDGSIRVAAVPEPETYALMLAGLGLVGFAARWRKLQSNRNA